MVEQEPFKLLAEGSNPSSLTSFLLRYFDTIKLPLILKASAVFAIRNASLATAGLLLSLAIGDGIESVLDVCYSHTLYFQGMA